MSKIVKLIGFILVYVIAIIGLIGYLANSSMTGSVVNEFHIVKGSPVNIERNLEHTFKQQYANILNYQYIKLFDYNILDMQVYRAGSFPIKYQSHSTPIEKVEHMITVLDSIPYTESQNNPAHWKQGLNCQGYALLFRQLCRDGHISNSIVHDSNHMFNIVTVDGVTYKIDLVKHIMERI